MPERATLPPAARRWLDRAAPASTSTPTHVAISQRGQLESGERWLDFRSEGTYRTDPLAFEWRARLRVMLGIWVIATDGHADGEGWGGAKLWGIRSLGQRSGPEVLATQLIRNIAELAWLPDLATADPALVWTEAGEDAFEISADIPGRKVEVRFDLDSGGDVVRASSPARPYDVPEGYEDAPWACEFSDHRDFGGLRVPASVVATYDLPDEPWEYFRAEIVSIERFSSPD